MNYALGGKLAKVHLVLERADFLQILDALRARMESWKATTEYLNSGSIRIAGVDVEECSDPAEAEQIVQHFGDIIVAVEAHL